MVLSFDPAPVGAASALSFYVHGSVTNTATASNLVISLRMGGAVVLTQTFALGTTARANRAWRMAGQVLFVGGNHVANMGGSVDLVTVQAPVGLGAVRSDSLGSFIELSVVLSVAPAGASVSVLGGHALRDY
jgi:hypothetical protein